MTLSESDLKHFAAVSLDKLSAVQTMLKACEGNRPEMDEALTYVNKSIVIITTFVFGVDISKVNG